MQDSRIGSSALDEPQGKKSLRLTLVVSPSPAARENQLGQGDFQWECLDFPNPLHPTAGLTTAVTQLPPASRRIPCPRQSPRARSVLLARKQLLGSETQRVWHRIWGKNPRQDLMGGTSLPWKPCRGMKLRGKSCLAPTKAQQPGSELAPTTQGGGKERVGDGGSCQAFPFKARARSGSSPFPAAQTTNPLPSSSSSLPGLEHPAHLGWHQGEKGSLAMLCQHHGGPVCHQSAHLCPLSHPHFLVCAR